MRREHAGAQRLGVLRHFLRIERPGVFGELVRVLRRRRNRLRRIARVDVHRRHVQHEMRPDLLEVEAHHAADAGNVRHEVEAHRQPLAPFALLQQQPVVTDADERDRILRIDDDFEVRRHVRARLQQRIRRSGDVAVPDPIAQRDALDDAAGDRSGLPLRRVRVQRERSGRALQIGRAHSRDRLAGGFDGRVVRRNLKQSRMHAVAFEQLPERRALAQQLGVRRFQRNAPATQRQRERRALDAGRGHVRREVLAVEMQEVEDAVAAGIHARDERGPGDRDSAAGSTFPAA